MNLSYYYDKVSKSEKEIADLQKKMADETKKEFDKNKQIDTVNRSINKNTSISTYNSKMRQIEGYQREIMRIQQKKADLQKKLAAKTQELNKNKITLSKEELKAREKQNKEQEAFQRKIQNDLKNQESLLNEIVSSNDRISLVKEEYKTFDFFISHASEDKESLVRPLAEKLIENGFDVWYDETELTIGDSLRRKIDQGLKSSTFGIVILSENFFKKNWPQYELDGMVARENHGVKVILPIWHKVTKDEVLNFSPTLADKVALNTSVHSLDEIADELRKLF
jgi:hypothetical protein